MKVSIDQKELLTAIATAKRAISNRATLPVLSGIRLSANGRFDVAATDLETTIRTSVDVKADEEGSVIVPGKFFEETVKGLKGQRVALVALDGELEVQGLHGTYRMKTISSDDYPALPVPDEGASVSIDAQALLSALNRVMVAVSTDESRQILTGVSFEIADGALTLAATDSYRLAVAKVECDAYYEGNFVLPARPLKELVRALKKAETVSLWVGDIGGTVHATFSVDSLEISARATCGEFPNYRQLIPNGYQNAVSFDSAAMLETVGRVGLYAQNNLPVKLTFGAPLEVSAHTPDVGEAREEMDAHHLGEPLVIAFNPQFLADGVKACGGNVTIEAGDGLKPALITGAGDLDYTYLLMPVRLS